MNMKSSQIQTYDDLKRQAATVGMVLSGIRVGQEVPNRDRYLTIGLELCDIVAERVRLGESPVSHTYEEAAFIDRFYPSSESGLRDGRLSELREQALTVRRVLQRLLHLEQVPADEVALSCYFCNLVYDAF